jgi:hypothetical protein
MSTYTETTVQKYWILNKNKIKHTRKCQNMLRNKNVETRTCMYSMLNMNKYVAYTKALPCINVTDKKLGNTYLKLDVNGEVKSVCLYPCMRLQKNRMGS